jgi:hypothetical protein
MFQVEGQDAGPLGHVLHLFDLSTDKYFVPVDYFEFSDLRFTGILVWVSSR